MDMKKHTGGAKVFDWSHYGPSRWGGLALRLAVCILHARHKDRRRRLTAAFLSAEAKCSLCGLRLSVGASWMDLSLRFDSPRTHTNEFGLRIMAVLPICHWRRGGGTVGREHHEISESCKHVWKFVHAFLSMHTWG